MNNLKYFIYDEINKEYLLLIKNKFLFVFNPLEKTIKIQSSWGVKNFSSENIVFSTQGLFLRNSTDTYHIYIGDNVSRSSFVKMRSIYFKEFLKLLLNYKDEENVGTKILFLYKKHWFVVDDNQICYVSSLDFKIVKTLLYSKEEFKDFFKITSNIDMYMSYHSLVVVDLLNKLIFHGCKLIPYSHIQMSLRYITFLNGDVLVGKYCLNIQEQFNIINDILLMQKNEQIQIIKAGE